MKTILVPTDFSKHAANALAYAASLAEGLEAKIWLLHTYHVPAAYTEIPAAVQIEHDIEVDAEKELKQLIANLKRTRGSLFNIEYINKEGFLIDTLPELVKEKAVDLIVMGTQGASGLEQVLLGSYTADVVEKVDCPVLVIPAYAPFHKPEKIMYATDFQFNDFTCINQVADLAKAFDAEIEITHISIHEKNKEQEEDLMDWFMEIAESNIAYSKLSYRTFTGENVLEKLNATVTESGIELLCMSTVRRTFFEKIFNSSLTKKMVYQTQIPLLVFHIQEPNRL
ncbi:universal stress protein [Rhodocytophaga aerolata]|uniref:Universal stress protein n=1 Tax=Rhodocytophaga aerolata TaxID=455078 RepID=A0ABT8R3R0_9BACT|nr:universal stress protein [Rhodocytophaga aerolata]MDO1446718.1 universal stress protein [Rhodocytophaga aerolata]